MLLKSVRLLPDVAAGMFAIQMAAVLFPLDSTALAACFVISRQLASVVLSYPACLPSEFLIIIQGARAGVLSPHRMPTLSSYSHFGKSI